LAIESAAKLLLNDMLILKDLPVWQRAVTCL
jgi:hypothetical protein